MGVDTVKIYCPKCSQVYHPPPIRSSRTGNASGVDGAAFGTTFPHLFLMTFSNLVPDPLPVAATYVPRVFGFRVHQSARQRNPSEAAALTKSAKVETVVDKNNVTVKGKVDMDDTVKPAPNNEGDDKRRRRDGNGNGPAFLLESNNPKRRKTTK